MLQLCKHTKPRTTHNNSTQQNIPQRRLFAGPQALDALRRNDVAAAAPAAHGDQQPPPAALRTHSIARDRLRGHSTQINSDPATLVGRQEGGPANQRPRRRLRDHHHRVLKDAYAKKTLF
jgi:hypothetical protein